MTNVLHDYSWLPSVCRGATVARTIATNPWTLADGERKFTAATSGHRMVIVDGDHGYPQAPDDIVAAILKVMAAAAAPVTTTFPIELDRLREFIAVHAADIPAPCDGCNDRGWLLSDPDEDGNDGDDDCPDCKSIWWGVRRVKIAGAFFNAWKIAPVLQHLPGDRAVWIARSELKPHVLMMDTWRLFLAPMRPGTEPESEAKAPVFDHTLRGRAPHG